MYKPYTSWLDFVKLSTEYPIALTFEVNKNYRPILSLKDIRALCTNLEMCNQNGYDYDFTIGLAELSDAEKTAIENISGVYIP